MVRSQAIRRHELPGTWLPGQVPPAQDLFPDHVPGLHKAEDPTRKVVHSRPQPLEAFRSGCSELGLDSALTVSDPTRTSLPAAGDSPYPEERYMGVCAIRPPTGEESRPAPQAESAP